MTDLQVDVPSGTVQGHFDEDFSALAEVFVHNFEAHGEVGASVCLTVNGQVVLDLWGGTKHQKEGTPWEKDTLSVIFSSTKGAVALAAHTLVSAGLLDLDAPVAQYWPEFAVNGKEMATVRMMLDHSAGVPCLRQDLPDGACCDWDYMVERIAREEAFWKPGTRNGYHMINFGWTVGELIRRVSGQSLGTYFRTAIAEPTEAECWIGLPAELEPKVAHMISARPVKGAPLSAFTEALINDRDSIPSRALFNQGGFSPNKEACHRAEIGGAGGIANARGLAKIYAPFACGGMLNGRTYVDAATLSRMQEVAVATHEDATLLMPTRFSLGFMKSMDNRRAPGAGRDSVLLGAQAFGHVGAGGSIGFADPSARMSLGYTMNRMGPGILMNERGQSLIDTAYRCMGYQDNSSGVWR